LAANLRVLGSSSKYFDGLFSTHVVTNELDLLSGTDINVLNANFKPSTDNGYKLGDSSHRWSDVWGTVLHVGPAASPGNFWSTGSGSPNSSVAAAVGSIYSDTSGGAGTTLYIKETGGTSNTGWNVIASASGFANLTLSNLTSPTSVNQSLIPSATSKNLGSSVTAWGNGYIGTVLTDFLNVNTGSLTTITALTAISPGVDAVAGVSLGQAGLRFINVYGKTLSLDTSLNWTSGTAVPSASPTKGSIYSRTNAGTATPLYVYNGSAWIDLLASSGGANTALSNLASTAVNTDINPDSGSHVLGTFPSNPWNGVNATNGTFATLHGSASNLLNVAAHLKPNLDGTWTLGDGSLRWANVGVSGSIFWNSNLQDLNGVGAPTSTTGTAGNIASTGSVYRNTSGGSGTTLYVKDGSGSTGWAALGASGAAGANQFLSNLLSPTAVSQSLLPQGPFNNKFIGNGSNPWQGATIQALSSNSVTPYSTSVFTVFGPLVTNGSIDTSGSAINCAGITCAGDLLPSPSGTRNLGGGSAKWGFIDTVNIGTDGIYTSSGATQTMVMLNAADGVQVRVGGSIRTITTTPTATPLYVV
jgi:hypothetical protein